MPTVYIQDDVFEELQKRAVPLVDDINSVLRKLLGWQGRKVTGPPVDDTRLALGKPPEGAGPSAAESPGHDARGEGTRTVAIRLNKAAIAYALMPVPRAVRRFFPGYKESFVLETAVGVLSARVTSGHKHTPVGDPDGGDYITGGLKQLYGAPPRVMPGDELRIEVLEPGKRYKASVIRQKGNTEPIPAAAPNMAASSHLKTDAATDGRPALPGQAKATPAGPKRWVV